MWKRRYLLLKPEGEGTGGGGGAAAGAGAAAGGAGEGAAAGAAAGGAGAGAAAGKAGEGGAGAGAGGSGAADVKATWREDWREAMAGGDPKTLAQLQRYASPEAVWTKTRSLETRLSSGELKPVLAKDATPEQLKEWRTAHGVPETADKYDLGKDVKIEEVDKPLFDHLFKAAHATHQTPDQVKSTVQTFYSLQKASQEHQAAEDAKAKQTGEDTLRAEWGTEFRRNMNLVNGLLDYSGSQAMKDGLLDARLPNGARIGDSPEAMKMLVGLALIQNPTGVVVPGGNASNGDGIREELDKLGKVPTGKKTEAQSSRQRDLINAAMAAGFMNQDGSWKK